MIQLEKNYFVYTGYISSPQVKEILCGLCSAKLKRPGGRIEARGWVAFHINNHTRERYCPKCAVKVWPALYAEALKQMET